MYGLAHQTIHIKFILKENSTENANGHRCAMLLPWCHRRSNGRKCWHKQSKCKCPRPAQYRSRISMHRMDNKIYTFSVHVMENRFKNLQTNSDFMHVGFVWLSLFLYEKNKNSFKKYMGRVWYDKSSISFRENVSIMLAENYHAIDLWLYTMECVGGCAESSKNVWEYKKGEKCHGNDSIWLKWTTNVSK